MDAEWLARDNGNRCVATGSSYRHNAEASNQGHSNPQQP